MSWIEELCKTYEKCIKNESLSSGSDRKPLLPPFHTLQNSHIEIIINGNGVFLDANFIIDKKDQEIIVPCTEKSSIRTSGEAPHPLCDKIQYCSKDYKGNKKSYFDSYIKLLEAWVKFDSSNIILQSIYQYVNKGTLCADINNTQKVFGKPGQDYGDFLIRWKVDVSGISENRCWKNKELFDSWRKFSEARESVINVCMVTGEKKSIAINHPKRIRNSGDGAKLISSNDKDGFTFLGRFTLDDFNKEKISIQAASVSVEASQKAHSALRWLIDRQGFKNDTQTIVSWEVSGKEIPDLFADSFALFRDPEGDIIQNNNNVSISDAGQTFARKLSKKIAGYKVEITNTDEIVILGLDSSGPGRLSIIYYRVLSGSEFLERIEQWHKQMAWHFRGAIPNSEVLFTLLLQQL